jgi:alpha-ribazole phosphatase
MRLLLVPHAETEWNVLGRFQGHADVPLNNRGRQQAQRLQQGLAEETFDAIVASDLCRAWETAQILALPHGLKVQAESRLRELHFGDWEGLTYAEVRERDLDALLDWEKDPLRTCPPGGERLTSMAQRVQDFLRELTAAKSSAILLVAHRGSLRVLLCMLLGRAVERHWEFRLDLASLSELEIVGGKAALVRLNEVAHGG